MFFLWTFFLMTLCRLTEPGPETPWADTYFTTAAAIANAAVNEPLGGPAHPDEALTASILVVMAWQESRFDPNAVGDHGGSVGLFQVSPPTAGVAPDVLKNPESAARIALRLIHQSFSICRKRPVEERLGWYMKGGNGCEDRLEMSRYRMNRARALVKAHPVNEELQ